MILFGNTYPVGLISRKAIFSPISMGDALDHLNDGFESFWGHSDTLVAVSDELGVDATPRESRPAISLDGNQLPTLFGSSFDRVIVMSPTYIDGFRPTYGEEVEPEKIISWECLLIEFP